MGAVNRSLRRGKAKATSDGSTSRGSRGRHSVSSFPTIPDQFIGDDMTDEDFDQYISGRGDANLPTLDSLFEDVDESKLGNLDRDEEPTPHNNDVDVEAGEPETSRGPDKVNPQNIPQNDQNVGGQPHAMLPTLMVNFLQQMTHTPMFQPPPPPLRLITFKTLKDNGAEEFLGDRIVEPQIALEWIEQTARVLQNLNIPLADHPKFASQLLQKEAYEWWKRTDENPNTPKPWTWEFFDWAFKKEYIPARFREQKRAEYIQLKQGDMTLPEYRQKFVHLAQFATTLVSTSADRIEEFRKRLRPDLRPHVSTIQTMDFIEAYDLVTPQNMA
ncbi:unnamed protein product [Cuscuta campestris]|uniref:Retrotransposon gag domain-containing protein n=1 Tax=Cuscuta campestris TaxID=132261 RepID=A0A484KQJ9_9ASTE|nr:unnamed protein product [Cuscuta campestris]